jgi:hypothetical protein
MRGSRWRLLMLYLAAILFVLAVALMGADYAGFRAAHGAGVTGTLLLLISIVLLAAKDFRVRHGHG